MPIIAKNIIVGNETREEPKAPPVLTNDVNSFNEIKSKVVRNTPVKESIEEKHHYEIVKEGDLVKHHNLKSSYLNDMTGFKN